jgi:hypothetical protein
MPSPRGTLPLWARAVDIATVGLLLLGLYLLIRGGFVLWPDSLRISMRSEWRVFAWAAGLIAVRHFFIRTDPLPLRIVRGVQAASRRSGPLVEDAGLTQSGQRRSFRYYAAYTAIVVVTYAVLTALMTYPQVRRLGAVSIDEGDALFSVWRLAWIAHQLPRDPLHLFDANIFYPERGTLAFSDAVIVPGLMAAPLLWLGVHQVIVYNIIFLSGFALSGAAMFLLVRSLTGHNGAAFIAGFVFAFLPYRYMHYAHLEMQMAFFMPLCLWALHRTMRWGRMRDGILTGLFFALQCLSCWYYGIFLSTFLAVIGLVLLVAEGYARAAKSVRALAAGGVLAVLIVGPMSLPYFSARRSVGERPADEIAFYSATPVNYIAAHPRNALYGGVTSKWAGQERELFMGFVVPLIALIGLWPPMSPSRIAYAVALVVAFDLSLGFNGLLYPWFHAYVLPYRGLRVPARMAMIVGLGLAVLAGYGAERLLRSVRSAPGTSRVVFAAMTALVFLEYRSTLLLKSIPPSAPPIYDTLSAGSRNVLLELPLIRPDISIEPMFMYYSTFHWYNLANGYSGFKPPSYDDLLRVVETFPDEPSVGELRRRGVNHVIVHQAYFRPGAYDTMVSRLDQCPEFERVIALRWRERESTLYRLLPKRSDAAIGVR